MSAPIVLLGPQRHTPTVRDAVRSLNVEGPVAVVTAGWEERELEHDELAQHLEREVRNLTVYGRVEEIFRTDRELLEAVRGRHDRMRRLQDYYRIELSYVLEAARDLLARHDSAWPDLLEGAVASAIEAVRLLDHQHLERVREVLAEFEDSWRPAERDSVAHHRDEISTLLSDCGGLCVAGGHVAILLNRMRLLGVVELAAKRPILAWSAGAMALSERVVLFHDSPPQGPGDAEVLECGLGVAPGVVPLPHASRRLRLEDRARVALFARRFVPARCIALDDGSRLEWQAEGWQLGPATRELRADGSVGGLAA